MPPEPAGAAVAQVAISPILAAVTGGVRRFSVSGRTVAEVLAALVEAEPLLALHLFTETGAVRQHIICIHRGTVLRPAGFAGAVVRPGDEIILANALAAG